MGIMFVLFGICAIVALMVASSIWSGYVLSILWGWFIVPTFGLPMLSIPVAIGLALIVSYLTKSVSNTKTDWGWSISIAIITPLVALCMGYVVHSFM
jgi:Na+(H+)/acetate symporter ActP